MNPIHLVLGLLLLLTYSLATLAQTADRTDRKDSVKRALEMREELHRKLMEHLFKGLGDDEEIFRDVEALFEDVMGNLGKNLGQIGNLAQKSYDMAWTESKEGRTLWLSPKDKGQRLEINVENGMISIKGKQESKVGNATSVSSFSHSYSVPLDCDGSKVKFLEKEGKIVMSFPYKAGSAPKSISPKKWDKDQRRPVPPSQDDVQI